MVKIENVKIQNILGKGGNGAVYNAVYANKEYSLKVLWIHNNEAEYSTEFSHWREIEALTTLSKQYPQYFKKVYDYDIIKKGEKTYCRMLMTKMDTTFDKIIDNMTNMHLYELYIQIIYGIYLMQTNGYVHRDYGQSNIGINYIDNKTVTIFGKKINTNGMHIMIHDFGESYNKKFKLSKIDKITDKISIDNDLLGCIYSFYNFASFIKYYKLNVNKRRIINYSYSLSMPNEIDIVNKYLNAINIKHKNKSVQNFYKTMLCQLLFTEKFEKLVLKKNKIEFTQFIEIDYIIPKHIILDIFTHPNNPKLIVELLIANTPL